MWFLSRKWVHHSDIKKFTQNERWKSLNYIILVHKIYYHYTREIPFVYNNTFCIKSIIKQYIFLESDVPMVSPMFIVWRVTFSLVSDHLFYKLTGRYFSDLFFILWGFVLRISNHYNNDSSCNKQIVNDPRYLWLI